MAGNRTIGIVAALGIAGAGAAVLAFATLGGPFAGPGDPATEAASETAASGAAAVELCWDDLLPEGSAVETGAGVVEHQQLGDGSPFQEMTDTSAVRAELDGKRVRLPGYMTPLDFESSEVSEFLLVPYVGACVHVPPPPANQIVYVTMTGTVPVLDMWEPLVAEGTLRAQARSTELAEVGYTLTLDHLELYEADEPDVFDDTGGDEPPPLAEGEEPGPLRGAADGMAASALENALARRD